jgi:catechol 2,3-dioxygenase-like lactoylglutathione lyase family enzyme
MSTPWSVIAAQSRNPGRRETLRRGEGTWLGAALLLALLAALSTPAPAVAARPERATVLEVGAIGMTVADLDRAVAFYTGVLGFTKGAEREVWGAPHEALTGVFGARIRTARLRLGDEEIELSEFLAPRGRPIPADSRSNDRWFQHVAIVVSDMAKAYDALRRHRVEHASTGPQRLPDWNPSAGGIEAFYFKDPDGHPLEVIAFPPGKGLAKWHRPTDRLFLGIDHTAIVVASTEASLALYRDALGLIVAGESENYGTEQEHLNTVFGARLRITSLRAGAGPGVEFLEYLAPRDGRPASPDTRVNDIVHRHMELVVRDAGDAAGTLRAGRYTLVSASPVALPAGRWVRALLARDPDGHAVKIVERRAQ